MTGNNSFIDVCAGCGGLSLGLLNAGWQGIFAVEKDQKAFSTLAHNFLEKKRPYFEWPAWLPQKNFSLEELLSEHRRKLETLAGSIDLIAGGPPCQGFSMVGRRNAKDPRNQVFRAYIELVRTLCPKVVLIENVRGILYSFTARKDEQKREPSYADVIRAELNDLDYDVYTDVVYARDYGVPQTRPRFILLGFHKSLRTAECAVEPFTVLKQFRNDFLKKKKLGSLPVTAAEALSDLLMSKNRLENCPETPRFKQGSFGNPSSDYQRLMHGQMNGELADSHRFANHRPETVEKFRWFQKNCRSGKKLDVEERGDYKTNKHTIYILDPKAPAPTVTTLPDDLLHYCEPRILTVREMARLQSFPDWFKFKGKYTTGGEQRVKECPRYTQVGNAVPPLLGEAIGRALLLFLTETQKNETSPAGKLNQK